MTKTTAIVLLSIVTVIVLFLGVFSFIPDFAVGEYSVYHSPVGLIQKSKLLTDKVTATYLVELDENVESFNAQKIIRARLRKAYGYYGVSVDYNEEDGLVTVVIPKTNNEARSSANNILSNVLANGKVEILSTNYTSASYSEDSVVLTQEHFKRASVRSYINSTSGTTLYVCRVKLNAEGSKIAEEKLTTSTPYTCAVDGEVETWVYYTGSELQITYASSDVKQSKEHAKVMASYINTDTLGATLTLDGKAEETSNNFAWIYLMLFGLIVLASLVFFAVRYKTLGIVPMIWQTCAVVVFTIFAGLVHIEMFNLAAAIGAVLAYGFMTFFTIFVFEKIRSAMAENKSYTWAKHTAFKGTMIVSLIAHGSLLVLGIILWVIPSIVTTPLGCVLVYGAVLSFLVTFCLNRLFASVVAPFYEYTGKKAKSKK